MVVPSVVVARDDARAFACAWVSMYRYSLTVVVSTEYTSQATREIDLSTLTVTSEPVDDRDTVAPSWSSSVVPQTPCVRPDAE